MKDPLLPATRSARRGSLEGADGPSRSHGTSPEQGEGGVGAARRPGGGGH